MLERTPSQTVGPYFTLGVHDAPRPVKPGEPRALRLSGRVADGLGFVDDALVELWHPEVGFGRCGTDAEGSFHFVVAKPLAADEAPHLNVMVFARGLLKPVVTRVYFPDEQEANERDPWLSSLSDRDRATVIARADGAGGLRFDVHLQGEQETTFVAF